MRRGVNICVAFILLAVSGCSDQILPEFPEDFSGAEVEFSEVRLVTYNIHGGKGPNGEGNVTDNLNAFEELLQGESIICLQEVEPDK